MKADAVHDILIAKFAKQNIDPRCLDLGKEEYASGNMIRKEISIKQGIGKEDAKKIVKIIKDGNLKVQASIMDDVIRVTGKNIDDLQTTIGFLRKDQSIELPLQFINMK